MSSHLQKVSDKCLVTHWAPYVSKPDVWYFDSGYSCRMIGDKEAFISLSFANGNMIKFSGGCMAHITGKGVVKIPNFPQLEKVCYVVGLTKSY